MRTCVRMRSPPYTELHCHSAFSFLDGASLPDELVAAACELGYDALALTDHNSVSGSMEVAVAGGPPRPLLVETATGWSSLCRILTHAHAHTRERPGPPSQPFVALETVLENASGLLCLSGCALRGVSAPAARRVRPWRSPDRAPAAVPPG